MEMTLMIAVGSVLLIGITRAARAQLKNAIDQRTYLAAMNLAKQKIAIENNSAYPTANGTTTLAADADFGDFTIQRTYTLVVGTYDPPAANNSVVEVRYDISSTPGGTFARFYTYRTDTAAFGNGA